jgi:transcriptional regulator with XRE-family HTH domain
MKEKPVPEKTRETAARSPRLSAELQQLRMGLGLSGERVALALKRSASWVSRMENGLAPISLAELEKLLVLYKVSSRRRDDLMTLAREGTSGDLPGPRGQSLFRNEYDEATTILEWAPMFVPRLLRTADYAEQLAVSSQMILRTLPSMIALEVEAILRQQEKLRSPESAQVTVILEESVLRRQFGTREMMHAQVTYLTVLGELPAVTLRILPLTSGTLAGTGQFTYFLVSDKVPAAVMYEHLGVVTRVRSEQETWTHKLAFGQLVKTACSEAETARHLDRAVKHWS